MSMVQLQPVTQLLAVCCSSSSHRYQIMMIVRAGVTCMLASQARQLCWVLVQHVP
jgi:hypothetical protein